MPKNRALREILAENVAGAMKAKALSQPKVAEIARKKRTPIDQTSVGRVMRGDFPASVDTIEAIANGLGVPAWMLLIPDGYDKNLLLILSAWSVSSESGRKLLAFAAEAAAKNDGEHRGSEGGAA